MDNRVVTFGQFRNSKVAVGIRMPDGRFKPAVHVFCDASQEAYAACVFLQEDGPTVSVQLIQSKARVATLKPATIPRLKLLACCIGARQAHSVKEAVKLPYMLTFDWTDSTTALGWIRRDEPWGTFVENRVRAP